MMTPRRTIQVGGDRRIFGVPVSRTAVVLIVIAALLFLYWLWGEAPTLFEP